MENFSPTGAAVLSRTLNQLKFAAKAWREISRDQSLPADRQLSRVFQENRKIIGSRDRKFISSVVYAVLRNQTYYEYWIQKFAGSDLRDPVKFAKFLCLLGAVDEGVADADIFKAAWDDIKDRAQLEHPRELFDAVRARQMVEKRENVSRTGWLALEYSFPDWLIERWTRDFGEAECEAILAATHKKPSLVIRANTLKISREELLKKLDPADGAAAVPGAVSAIQFRENPQVKNTPLFEEGLFEIQSTASQKVVELMGLRPGEKVWDVCAGSGGKTLFIAALMQNQGQVVATDLRSLALKELKARALRAGAEIIKIADIQRFYRNEVQEKFDKIVVDAPCSGTGTLGRAPDLKWRLSTDSFEQFAIKQLEIMEMVRPYLKETGQLFYITCSLDRAENEAVADCFLARHSELKASAPVRIWPHRDHTDGFFMCSFSAQGGSASGRGSNSKEKV